VADRRVLQERSLSGCEPKPLPYLLSQMNLLLHGLEHPDEPPVEEFAPCVAWWTSREESERAWKVPVADLLAGNCNLDRKTPRAKEDIIHLPPEQLLESIAAKEQRILEIVQEIRTLLGRATS